MLSDVDITEATLRKLVQDIVLLKAIGIKLVLVQNTRHNVATNTLLVKSHAKCHDGRLITTYELLGEIQAVANRFKEKISSLIGQTQYRTMNQSLLISGNFISAKPLGVNDGIDHKYTGNVRRINSEAIKNQLQLGAIVYLDNLAYSPTGQLYNLESEELAAKVAVELKADKLILFGKDPYCTEKNGDRISEMTLENYSDLSTLSPDLDTRLQAAKLAVQKGVERTHLLGASVDGALLTELMTVSGSGTMIAANPAICIRQATANDLAGLVHLLSPLEEEGILAHRSRVCLEEDLRNFFVVEQDALIIGSAALIKLTESAAELAAMAVDPEKTEQEIGSRLMTQIESTAIEMGIQSLFVLTTKASDWFIERGFQEVDIDALPDNRRALYNHQRNSRILKKSLQN